MVQLLDFSELRRECPIPLSVQTPSLRQREFQTDVLVVGIVRKTHGVHIETMTLLQTMENLQQQDVHNVYIYMAYVLSLLEIHT
jgi:hypothetical protein